MDVATQVQHAGRQADTSEWMDHAVRLGLVSYGVVHLILAWLAVQLAFGEHSGSATQQGAMQQLAHSSLGRLSLWVVGGGFVALVVWQLTEAAWGHRDARGAKRTGKRGTSLAKVVVYAALALSAFKTAAAGSSSGSGTDGITAKLMALPAGPLIVGLVGLTIIAIGGFLVVHGWQEKFRRRMRADGQTGKDGRAYVLFGKVGYLSKGVAFALVGLLFCYAALTHDPDKSGGLDQALRELLRQPFGAPMLVAIAAGLACYGLFCFAWAKHLRR